ncbi:hypothetical protein EAO73_28445 [Streptomyces sp. col6]|uniref:hypothetical protein n=1 Tax=Streptomyces sp. col6 TaxID=2478958 RepID=UPI0011CE027A|nr:hypothetical protein [Streptomyces sp. col6]TXR99837.1 hypothetical protein EAO73_28445 [Streptomyces sp. col6]
MKLLAGLAVAALSGCVSVQPQPAAPPRSEVSRPAHHLAPQIARSPVHDTLEAVPKAERSPSASPSGAHRRHRRRRTVRRSARPRRPPRARPAEARPPLRQQPRPAPVRPLPRRIPPAVPAPALPAPGGGTGVCALGRGYGHWPAGSPQSRICDHTYGR